MQSLYILIFLMSTVLYEAVGQACCSGGVPLTNNIGGLPRANSGELQFSLSFDANFLRTLKAGSEQLDDRSRKRTTYSVLFKSAYTLSDRLVIEGLFSWVRQERAIEQVNGFEDFTATQGLGDMILLFNYTYLKGKNWEAVIGGGPKIPTGPADLRNDNGITLNADLQPGSGAWDAILNHRFIFSSPQRPTFNVTNMISYKLNGKNRDYLGSQVYQFGNELQIISGVSEQFMLGTELFNLGLNLRYRNVQSDLNNDEKVPGTGGNWIFAMPLIAWNVAPNINFTFNAEFPLYSYVDETQLTPTYRINAGIYFLIKTRTSTINDFKF